MNGARRRSGLQTQTLKCKGRGPPRRLEEGQLLTQQEVIIRIGGAAGDGVASTGEIFAKTSARSGLHVYAYNSYQSVIRGGHVWFQIRASGKHVDYVGQEIDILIALNKQTVDAHLPHVRANGVLIYDPSKVKLDESAVPEGVRACPMPLLETAQKYSKNPIMANTVAVGAAMGFIGAKLDIFRGVIEDQFGHKKADVVEANIKAAEDGYKMARDEFGAFEHIALPYDPSKKRYLLTGNQAIALGMIAAGVRFYSFYPMTPATSIGQYLAEQGPELGVVVKQAEDEIAVANMAIGASFAGARSACGTSGGGFALMAEAMSFAGMVETPLVVVNSQRTGPSTGLPTKTEQGDLYLLMGAGQGDYPKAIVSPRNVEEAFYHTKRAFNLAEKYQMPIFIASDLLLSEHYETVEGFDFDRHGIDRGKLMLNGQAEVDGPVLRYQITDDGTSPRPVPGVKGGEHIAGSDEHDEDGTLVSDVRAGLPEAIEVRIKQMDKRMLKMENARDEMEGPELFGPRDAPVTLVSWGSTQGAVREAMEMLEADGVRVNSLEFRDIHPLNAKATTRAFEDADFLLFVEGNYTGQLERHIRAETGLMGHDRLHKYDGEPFWPEEIVKKVHDIMKAQKLEAKGVA